MRRSARRAVGGACLLVLGAGAGACAAEDATPGPAVESAQPESSAGPSAPTASHDQGARSSAGARRAVRDYLDAFFGNRTDAACALMTLRYQEENIAAGKDYGIPADATCPQAMAVAVEFAQALSVGAEAFAVGQAVLQGDRASVAVTGRGDLRDNTYSVIWDGSGWLVDSDDG